MPDTGAPWNIPYVAGTDLVADWPTDSQTLAEAIADGLDAAGTLGQVLQAVKTNTFASTSNTFTDVTGLTQAITPASATNKVLVIAHVNLGWGGGSAGQSGHVALAGGNAGTYIGDASSSRVRSAGFTGINDTQFNNTYYMNPVTMVYLDSPATTSSTTYSVQVRRGGGGTVYVNRSGANADTAGYAVTASSITLLEVNA